MTGKSCQLLSNITFDSNRINISDLYWNNFLPKIFILVHWFWLIAFFIFFSVDWRSLDTCRGATASTFCTQALGILRYCTSPLLHAFSSFAEMKTFSTQICTIISTAPHPISEKSIKSTKARTGNPSEYLIWFFTSRAIERAIEMDPHSMATLSKAEILERFDKFASLVVVQLQLHSHKYI